MTQLPIMIPRHNKWQDHQTTPLLQHLTYDKTIKIKHRALTGEQPQ